MLPTFMSSWLTKQFGDFGETVELGAVFGNLNRYLTNFKISEFR